MRQLVTIILLFAAPEVFAQKADLKSLGKAMEAFDNALVNRDSTILKQILSEQISYGHSNGWIEKKPEVIGDLYNGKLTYKRINSGVPEIVITDNTAAVRTNAAVDAVMEGKEMSFKLKVLQVWVWTNKHWVLFARQSVKI